MKRNRKWEIPHTVSERRTLRFSSYKNRKIRSKIVMSWSSRKKKRKFFVPFILSEGKFFNILLYKNIYTFIYQKALLHTLFCLILKSSKAFSVFLSSEEKSWQRREERINNKSAKIIIAQKTEEISRSQRLVIIMKS